MTVGGDASGVLTGLSNGAQTLAVVAPTGYAPLHGDRVSVWLNGADVTLSPLAFRFTGALRGQVFADEDGDGWLRSGEKGALGAVISLIGPASASAVTDGRGRFSLPNLVDGVYTVSVTPPAGYAATAPQTITLNDGGTVSAALRPLGKLTGVIYEDWDGDGRRGAQRTALGAFRFWNVAEGSYTITPSWLAVNPVAVSTASGAVALPAVPSGEVRALPGWTATLTASASRGRHRWPACR